MADGGSQTLRVAALDINKIDTVEDLARVLRQLRRRHARRRSDSELTYRELAAKVGWSHAVIGEYFGGKALPPTDRFDVLVRLLGATPAELGALATARDRVEEHRRASSSSGGPGAGTPPPVPRQLPADVFGFTGRTAQLAELHRRLDTGSGDSAVMISALSGTAGVGKTALAVHWAHQVVDRFPDGQLYVNLRGFDPGSPPLSPGEALRGFLDALNVPAQRMPSCLEAQVGLYRSLLADKRVLVLVDNARDAEQVRPLLPGAPGCLVLVTSRSQLPGLLAVDGARPLTLDLLTPAEAWQLLTRRLGADRVSAEPHAVDEIIERCARLPLALTIVAARAASHPNFPLAASATELRDAGSDLDPFAGGDEVTDVRAVFSWSYHTLGEPAGRLFRLLGLHTGPDIAAPAAASLAGVPLAEARRLLGELTRAHLVTEHSPGRYTFHDLLRAYATELAHSQTAEGERRAAVHRVLDHYVHTAVIAAHLIKPYLQPSQPPPPQPHVTPQPLADGDQAMAWFTAEHAVLMAAVDRAAADGFDTQASELGAAVGIFCQRRGHSRDQVTVQTVALQATRRLGNRDQQALAHREIGRAYVRLGQDADAWREFEQALALWESVGNLIGQASAHNNMAEALDRQGRPGEALGHSRRALHLYRTASYRIGEAWALNGLGWLHVRLGEHGQAVRYCEEALTLAREIADHQGQAATLDSLGYAHLHLGHHGRAIACFEQALQLIRAVGDRYQESDVLRHLGEAHRAAGHDEAVRQVWTEAAEILEELDHPDAAKIRADLQGLRTTP